jgi:hypothetical protein
VTTGGDLQPAAERRCSQRLQDAAMAQLFDNDDPDASQGFKNLKAAAADSTGGQIREGLETLWKRFEPYADKEFIKEFGRHPEERFWEMYMGVRLLEGRKAFKSAAKKRARRGA